MPPPLRPTSTTPASPVLPLDGRARRLWGVTLAATVLVLALAVAPPWLPEGVRAVVHDGFSAVCHQMASRSFHAHGVAFAVCHRCTGIYAGLVVGVLAWPLVRTWGERTLAPRVPLALGLATLPLSIDWALGFFGLWENTPPSQATTGAVFGVVAGLLLARGLAGGLRRVHTAPLLS